MSELPESSRTDSSPAPAWLLVEDDILVGRALYRFLRAHGKVLHAVSVAEAHEQIVNLGHLCGVILDVKLPDGNGLDVLRAIRARGCEVPALIITAHNERETISQAQLLGAMFLWKPWSNDNLRAFVARTRDWWAAQGDLVRCLDELATRHRLSTRECEIVRLATVGWAVEDLPHLMGVSRNTVKTMIRRILHKTEVKSIADLARGIHRRLLAPR